MKTKHWINRILVSLMIFCLAMTSFGVEPAQASPPADDDLPDYTLELKFTLEPPTLICLKTKTKIVFSINVDQEGGKSYRTEPFKNVEINISANLGRVTPKRQVLNDLMIKQTQRFQIEYTAAKKGIDKVIVEVYVPGVDIKKIDAPFDVKPCKSSIHGTADMGATANALSPGDEWNFVGTYAVAGTVEMNEDGFTNGQGTAGMFMDGIATAPEVGCEFTSPIQGDTTIEVKADPDAWANGILQLQIHLQPMPVSFGGIGCTSFGTNLNTGGVTTTTAAFDLNLAPLPADGGVTSLEFQLPGQPGTFKMYLIAVSEEAES